MLPFVIRATSYPAAAKAHRGLFAPVLGRMAHSTRAGASPMHAAAEVALRWAGGQ